MPQVLEALEKIASTYTKLKKASGYPPHQQQKGQEIEKAVERRFQKQKLELVELMEGVHLNNARIESPGRAAHRTEPQAGRASRVRSCGYALKARVKARGIPAGALTATSSIPSG